MCKNVALFGRQRKFLSAAENLAWLAWGKPCLEPDPYSPIKPERNFWLASNAVQNPGQHFAALQPKREDAVTGPAVINQEIGLTCEYEWRFGHGKTLRLNAAYSLYMLR